MHPPEVLSAILLTEGLDMNKDEFKGELMRNLRKVSFEERKKWQVADLMDWWFTLQRENSYLRIKSYQGDHWQYVHAICQDHIGERAIA